MTTHEAMQVLRDLMLDDSILDPAQIKAVRMAIAALDDVRRREQRELEALRRWNAGESTSNFH